MRRPPLKVPKGKAAPDSPHCSSGWRLPFVKAPVAAALLLAAVATTTGTAAAVLTGAVSSSACAAVLSPTNVPIVPTSMYPTAGYPAGGTQVTITGGGFGAPGNTNVWAVFEFGYTPARQDDLVTVAASVINDATIDIPSTPAEQNGSSTANVYLATANSYALTTTLPWQLINFIPVATFTYTNNPPPTTTTSTSTTSTSTTMVITVPAVAPVVDALDPPDGLTAGGTPVSVVGTNFTGATAVSFGGTPATSFTVVSAGLISAVAPAGSGATNVIVTTPAGSSGASTASGFTFTTNLPAIKTRPKPACTGG